MSFLLWCLVWSCFCECSSTRCMFSFVCYFSCECGGLSCVHGLPPLAAMPGIGLQGNSPFPPLSKGRGRGRYTVRVHLVDSYRIPPPPQGPCVTIKLHICHNHFMIYIPSAVCHVHRHVREYESTSKNMSFTEVTICLHHKSFCKFALDMNYLKFSEFVLLLIAASFT